VVPDIDAELTRLWEATAELGLALLDEIGAAMQLPPGWFESELGPIKLHSQWHIKRVRITASSTTATTITTTTTTATTTNTPTTTTTPTTLTHRRNPNNTTTTTATITTTTTTATSGIIMHAERTMDRWGTKVNGIY